jgi:hypothetical protein
MNPFSKLMQPMPPKIPLKPLREIEGMGNKYPFFAAFRKWLAKLSSKPIDTPEDVIEENNRIFAAFVFLLNHDYLFYLIVNNQIALIHQLFEKKVIREDEKDILLEIQQQYQRVMRDHHIAMLHKAPVKADPLSQITELGGYFLIGCDPFDLYWQLDSEYQYLTYQFLQEQIEVFFQVLKEEGQVFIDEISNDTSIPDDIKNEVVTELTTHLQDFESALLEVETELNAFFSGSLSSRKSEAFSNRSARVSIESTPTLPDSDEVDSLDSEASSDVISEESIGSEVPIDIVRDESADSEVLSEPAKDKSADSGRPSELGRAKSTDFEEQSHNDRTLHLNNRVDKLKEIWERRASVFLDPISGQLRHSSLHVHFERHRKTTTKIQGALDLIRELQEPLLLHVSNKLNSAQHNAREGIKEQIDQFIGVLSGNSALSPEAQVKVTAYIQNLEVLQEQLESQNSVASIQEVCKDYLQELHQQKMDYLFLPEGGASQFKQHYYKFKDYLNQKANQLAPDPVSFVSQERIKENPVEKEMHSAVSDKREKLRDHLNRGREQRARFFPAFHKEKGKEGLLELIDLNEEKSRELKSMIQLIKGFIVLPTSQVGVDGKRASTTELIKATIKNIEGYKFEKIKPSDLTSLSNGLRSLSSTNNVYSKGLDDFSAEVIRNQQKPAAQST